MDNDDVSFLRDQVQRLTAVLSEYKKKYPPIELPKDEESPDIPWIADRQLMSPLLAEYDSNIKLLKDQLNTYQSEQKDLRAQVDKLVAENKRLNKDLKDAIEHQLHQSHNLPEPIVATTSGLEETSESIVEDQVIQNLHQQIQIAIQEKDSAMEMCQAAVSQVERLEKAVQNQQFNPRLQGLEHQANQIKEQYVRTVAELNNEIRILQEELNISKNECKIAQNQSIQLRKTLEDLRHQLSLQEHEIVEVAGDKQTSDSKAGLLQKKTISLESHLKRAEMDMNQMKHDNVSLEQKIVELQKKNADSEQKAYEAALTLRENVEVVDAAVLEKDEALQREKLANDEISRLQEAISSLLDQAGTRTRQEVDSVREQCNRNLSSLMEEIHTLELETSEKQAQIDRAIREKRAAESELEKIYKEGMVEGHKEKTTVDELNRRACDAERMRDEALVKMEAMQGEMKRLDMTLRQEKSHMTSEMEQLKDRLTMMNHEFEMANDDRVKLTEKIDELQRKMVKLQQERDAAQRNCTKEVTCLDKDHKLKLKELEVRLHTSDDTHRKSMMEVRQMLQSQQRMSAKWKEECNSITAKFESKVQDLREENKRGKHRNSELTNLLKESRDKTIETENMLTEYTRNIKRLEERVRESENRAASAAMQARSLRPDRDIIEERKQLQRELERSLRESKASLGPMADPLAMSDLMSTNNPVYNSATGLHEELAAR